VTNPKLVARLRSFRQELYDTLGLRQDSLFELMDAVLTAPERRTLVRLSLCPCFRRRWSSTCDALADGSLDVAQLFEPFVEQAVSAGGHVWFPASARGRTSYTVFVTRRERLAADPEPFRRMVRAIYRTQRWVDAEPPESLAAAIADYFPALEREVLTRALARYKEQGVWGRDPVLPEAGFDRLRRALLGNGFLSREVPFGDCVDNRLAEAAVAQS